MYVIPEMCVKVNLKATAFLTVRIFGCRKVRFDSADGAHIKCALIRAHIILMCQANYNTPKYVHVYTNDDSDKSEAFNLLSRIHTSYLHMHVPY